MQKGIEMNPESNRHQYRNPILPGFYPDPSLCRVGSDFYLVTSSFEFFPGVPVFHSRDLVHWEQIANALDRPSQLPLDEVEPSDGIWAATIRYQHGTFYIITTNATRGGNFIVTSENPAGPWSEPYWLDDEPASHAHWQKIAPGIDPSLFFDDDGKAWYTGNRVPPHGSREAGEREIWLQELDLDSMTLKGEVYMLWEGERGHYMEGPHIYKRNGYYYLLVADGGTGHEHAVLISRSTSITGPYHANIRNPILTHRHLGKTFPVVNVGHADLVETGQGEWWMVALGSRPYGGYYRNLGRETFLAPVIWEDDWPVVAPGIGHLPEEYVLPDLEPWEAASINPKEVFREKPLALHWNFIRTPRQPFHSFEERPGWLRLHLKQETLSDCTSPAFIGQRQRDMRCEIQTLIDFSPRTPFETAGLALFMNHQCHYRFVLCLCGGKKAIRLIQRQGGNETVRAEQVIGPGECTLIIEVQEQELTFSLEENGTLSEIAGRVDGRILIPDVAGGNTGVYVGMYCSSNGTESDNAADYAWFSYTSRTTG